MKRPHSGRPFVLQPEPRPILMMSDQPSDCFGHPSASAMGFHIAITTGETTTESPPTVMGVVCPGWAIQRSFSSAV